METAGALGAYRDALALIDAVREHAGPADLPRLLARRGDLLMALGDPEAVAAYQEAAAVTTGTEHRLVRARLARAAAFAGDLDTARAALAGLSVEGDAADGPILLARGNLAYFTGDLDTAWDAPARRASLMSSADDPWHFVDLISLQGLIAHQRGEWFERFRLELRRTRGKHVARHCALRRAPVRGGVPALRPGALRTRSSSEARSCGVTPTGSARCAASPSPRALIGEAALLMGDLPRAERELLEAVELHRDIDAPAGEAHSLQRLAEVRLARGDRTTRGALLQRALPLARWSVMSKHLLQRIYGTMIAVAPDAESARAVVDQAEATLGTTDRCPFCAVMLAVPAAIACAEVGDLDEARRHLATAQRVRRPVGGQRLGRGGSRGTCPPGASRAP